jgi:asparagine N-glycosylation enzyme membrane subunit Stt3
MFGAPMTLPGPALTTRPAVLLRPGVQAALAAALALAVYAHLAPTVMWYDMGEFATAAYVLGVAHNTGYPLLLLLGKLFTLLPVGDVAYRVNLMSAVFGALTVLCAYLLVFDLTGRRSPAAVAALALAFSSTLWSNATWATSYDLNAVLTARLLLLAVRGLRQPNTGYSGLRP